MSVAVLYFNTLSRDSSDALLADGFTEELIVRLGQVESLVVRSRGLVQRYRGEAGSDPMAAGRALNSAYVVSGTFRRNADRVRITAEMARSATGAQVWADVFERSSADLMGIEGDLARAVATAIAGRLRPRDQAALARQPTRAPAAWARFITGNALMTRRETVGLAGAIQVYRDAVRIDPGFAAAWGRLAEALALTPAYERMSRSEAGSFRDQARQAADRALALDSSCAEAWLARGFAADAGDYRASISAFERAAAIDPTFAEAHYALGANLRFASADHASAERHLRRALQLDPAYTNALRWLGMLLWSQGRMFESLALHDSLRALAPSLAHGPLWANIYMDLKLRSGDSAGARAELADLLARQRGADSTWVLAIAARVTAGLGDTVAARRYLRAALAGTPDSARTTTDNTLRVISALAAALVALGEPQRALDLLENHRGDGGILWSELRAPYFAPLAGEPRFARLLERVWPR